MDLIHTKRSGCTLHHIRAYNVTERKRVDFWQHRDVDGRQVGPQYPTKAEALADTNDYVVRAGWCK